MHETKNSDKSNCNLADCFAGDHSMLRYKCEKGVKLRKWYVLYTMTVFPKIRFFKNQNILPIVMQYIVMYHNTS